jgi:filamentous hemagglutinin family protein
MNAKRSSRPAIRRWPLARPSPLCMVESAGRLATALGISAALALAAPALAGPEGGKVVAGSATFHQNGSTTTINAANNTIINYRSFNIGAGETVRFVQPSATSRVLNRITGDDPSVIAGTLQSNGIVYIANPAGVFFANGALVDVGGIYAAAGRISNADFLNNINRFTLTGAVENHGQISARAGSAVHLLGQRVANFGTIVAPHGLVTMAAGDVVYIGRTGGQIMARIAGTTGGESGITQAGEIAAEQGRISLGAGDMYALAIDHRGTSRAREIALTGGSEGVVSVSGTLDATAARGRGGTVKVLGEKVGLMDGGAIDASGRDGGGTVLFGGNRMGQGPEPNSTAAYIGPEATIRADALHHGKGGTVIVWSDEVSRIYGELSARGGAAGGNGGFIETSSARELRVTRTPDVTARAGWRGGTWLIDPEDLNIVPGDDLNNVISTPPPPASIFESSGEGAELGVDLIVAALTGGASVEVRTGAGGPAEGGTITLVEGAEIDFNGTGSNTLSLIAHRDIILNGHIFDSDAGAGADLLNLILTADSGGGGNGRVVMNGQVDTGGGDLTVSGFRWRVNSTASVNTRGGNITSDVANASRLYSDLDAGGGDITFNNMLVVEESIAFTARNVTFNGPVNSQANRSRDLSITASGDIRFNEEVGKTVPLGALRTGDQGRTIINTPHVQAVELNFGNPVVLNRSTTLIGSQTATFASTVDSEQSQFHDFTVRSGAATFAGNVGGGQNGRLGAFTFEPGGTLTLEGTVQAASVHFRGRSFLGGGVITTTGDQVYDAPVTLLVDNVLTGENITFNARVSSPLTADRGVTLNPGSQGVVTFNGAIGDPNPLKFITVSPAGSTIFAGGRVATSGNQVYDSPVVVQGNTTVSGSDITFHETIESGPTPRALTVNPTGTAKFVKTIGATNALQSLTIGSAGKTELEGGAVTTVGPQAYNNPVFIGADTTLHASAITFGRTLDSDLLFWSIFLNTLGNGITTFNGAVGGTNAIASLITNADGITRIFGPSITTTDGQTYNNPVLIGSAAAHLTGSSIGFLSTIDSTELLPGALSVTATSNGLTTFAGEIGGANPLRSLTTSNGTTRIGANINTTDFMLFNNAVVLTGDAVLRDSGTGISFRSTINSDAAARALTLLVNPDSNATVESPQIARISFGSHIGVSNALRSLHLGSNRSTNPTTATIVGGIGANDLPIAGFGMTINTTEGFSMGQRQKFTVLGNLTINSASALLGDITAVGNLTVNSPDIAIQTRPAGQTLVRQGNALVVRNDPGVDIIASNQINFSSTPRTIGEDAQPAFGTPDGSSISATLNEYPHRAIGPVGMEQVRLGTTYLDLRAAGPGTTNVAEVIAGAAPRIEVSGSPEEAAHGRSQLEELAQLGLQTRGEDDPDSLPFLATVVHDDSSVMYASDTRISTRRLPPGAAAEVLGAYRVLFYGSSAPVRQGEQPESRAAHISQVLASAWADYSQAVGKRADAIGFRAYVEAIPAQAEALHYLNSLRDLFNQMGYLGLTSAELRQARQEIVRSVAFPGLSPAQLETAIMATYMGAFIDSGPPVTTR